VSVTRWRGSRSSSTSSSASAASAEQIRRRRLVALLVAAAVVAVGVVLLVGRGGGPDDPLARLAPPDALGWLRVDPHADLALAARFPGLRALPEQLAGDLGLRASQLDLGRDVRSWAGHEAGLAWLPGGGRLLLVAVAHPAAAEAALRRLGARALPGGRYALAAPGAAAGIAGGTLAAGPEAAVRAALARARGGGEGLAGTAAFAAAMRSVGSTPFAGYAPAAGVQQLVGSGPALVRNLAGVLNGSALEAVGAALVPEAGGVRVHARLVRSSGARAPATFAQGLLGRVPLEGTVALLDLPGGSALEGLLARLGGAGALAAAQTAVGDPAGVDLDRDVLGPLRGEAALSVQARGDVPVFTLVAHSAGPATTREALARLQTTLAARLTGGAARGFEVRRDGTFTLPVTARLQPSYGVSGDLLVATTAQPGLEQLRVAPRGIVQAPALAKVLDAGDGDTQALGFFDLHALLQVGERTGLITGASFAAVRADLEPIEAVGAAVRQDQDHPTQTTAELFLQIP
jgi:Protein of unknown function (DUF3352)